MFINLVLFGFYTLVIVHFLMRLYIFFVINVIGKTYVQYLRCSTLSTPSKI